MVDSPQTGNPSGFLRKKVFGKIPMLYVLLGGAVVLGVIAWRMKPAKTGEDTPPEATDATATDGTTDGDATPNLDDAGGFVANPQPVQGAPVTTPNDSIEDNQQWYAKSVGFLVKGGVSAGVAQVALSKYLEGEQLSYYEGTLRDKVVKEYGVPPEYFKPGGTTGKAAAPAKRQGPLPRTHKVTNSNDDTYVELAKLYYSNGSAANVQLIKAENTPNGLSGNGPFAVGTGVRIPKYVDPAYFTSTTRDNTLREIASKNGRSQADIQTLNPGMKFPVKKGTRVRVK